MGFRIIDSILASRYQVSVGSACKHYFSSTLRKFLFFSFNFFSGVVYSPAVSMLFGGLALLFDSRDGQLS